MSIQPQTILPAILVMVAAISAPPAHAQIIVNGLFDPSEYDPELATQTISTGFGDNFSELNEAFALNDGSDLSILTTGNLETNGNRLVFLFDTAAGGSATIPTSGSNFDQNIIDGSTFDTAPEFALFLYDNAGSLTASLRDLTNDSQVVNLILSGDPDAGTATGSAGGLDIAWTNANTLGVGAGPGTPDANASTATSGIEFSIASALLGGPSGDIDVTSFVVSNTGFYSNQFLSPLPDFTANLGFGPIDTTAIAGDQFFTVPFTGVLPPISTWDGPASGGSFSDITSWDPDGVPDSIRRAVINSASVAVSSSHTIDSIVLDSSAQLDVNGGGTIEIIGNGSGNAGQINVAGTFNVEGDTANLNTVTVGSGGTMNIGEVFGATAVYDNTNATTTVQAGGDLIVNSSWIVGGTVGGGGGGPGTGGDVKLFGASLDDVEFSDVVVDVVGTTTLRNTITNNTTIPLEGDKLDIFLFSTVVVVDGPVTLAGSGDLQATSGTNTFNGTGVDSELIIQSTLSTREATANIPMNNMDVTVDPGGVLVSDFDGHIQVNNGVLTNNQATISAQRSGSINSSVDTVILGGLTQAVFDGQIDFGGNSLTINTATLFTDGTSSLIKTPRNFINLIGNISQNARLLSPGGGFSTLQVDVFGPTTMAAQDASNRGEWQIAKTTSINLGAPGSTLSLGLNQDILIAKEPFGTSPTLNVNVPLSLDPTATITADEGAQVIYFDAVDNDGNLIVLDNSILRAMSGVTGTGLISNDATSSISFEYSSPHVVDNDVTGSGPLSIGGFGGSATFNGQIQNTHTTTVTIPVTFTDSSTSFNVLDVQSGTTTFQGGVPSINELNITFNTEVSSDTNSIHNGPANLSGGTVSGPGAWIFNGTLANKGGVPTTFKNTIVTKSAVSTLASEPGGGFILDNATFNLGGVNPDVMVTLDILTLDNGQLNVAEGTNAQPDADEVNIQGLLSVSGVSAVTGTPKPGDPTDRPELRAEQAVFANSTTFTATDHDITIGSGGSTVGSGVTFTLINQLNVMGGTTTIEEDLAVILNNASLIHDGSTTIRGEHSIQRDPLSIGIDTWGSRADIRVETNNGTRLETFTPINPGDNILHHLNGPNAEITGTGTGPTTGAWGAKFDEVTQTGGDWNIENHTGWDWDGGGYSGENGAQWEVNSDTHQYAGFFLNTDDSGVQVEWRGQAITGTAVTANIGDADSLTLEANTTDLTDSSIAGGGTLRLERNVPGTSSVSLTDTDITISRSEIEGGHNITTTGTGGLDIPEVTASNGTVLIDKLSQPFDGTPTTLSAVNADVTVQFYDVFPVLNPANDGVADSRWTTDMGILAFFPVAGNGIDQLELIEAIVENSSIITVKDAPSSIDKWEIEGDGEVTIVTLEFLGGETRVVKIIGGAGTAPGIPPGLPNGEADVVQGLGGVDLSTVGKLIHRGDLGIEPAGVTELELGGTLAATPEFDILEVEGSLALEGTLDVFLLSGFTPILGDTFQLITATTLTGVFANENLPALSGGLGWQVNQDATSYSLEVVLPGDLDGDGFVGINDLNSVLANWNQNIPPANPLADPSGDGFVGIDDLNLVLGNWNAGTPPGAPNTSNQASDAPEPASMLIFTGLLGLLNRRV